MNFRDYKHFNNPRGLRNDGPYTAFTAERYTGPRMGWAKLVVGGTEHVGEVGRLLGNGCMPIVQIYRERMGAAPAEESWYAIYQKYIDAGALWFELYDEPNLPHFWPLGRDGQPNPTPDWVDRDACIAPVMDHWLDWAERIAAMGAYPAFPALGETTVPEQATVSWYEACLNYLAQAQGDRFGKLIAAGLWCAVHPYLLNHFYQEPPGGPPSAARPYYQQSHKEGGWHFEYPYDPLQQHDDPGRTPFGGTGKTPFGDPNGLVCSGEIFTELIMKMFGAGPVPVVGTAGGIWPIPAADAEPVQPDSRYQGYNRDSHAEATAAMLRWIAQSGPPWMLGLALTRESDYYPGGAPLPAIRLLMAEPVAPKEGPDLEIRPGKVIRSMVQVGGPAAPEAPVEASPLDPFAPEAPDEGRLTMPEPLIGQASGEAAGEQPKPEKPTAPIPERGAFGAIPDLDFLMSDPIFATPPAGQEPPPEPPPAPPVTLAGFEPPQTTLKEMEDMPTTLAEFEAPEHQLMKPEPPVETPVSDMEYEGSPDLPGPAADEEAREEAAAEVATSSLWPAPDAREEAPEPEPVPPESIEMPVSASSLWPAPDAREEAPEPEPVPPESIEMPVSASSLWPAPDAREGAPAPEPAPVEPAESGPVTALWPAPETGEEVHTPPAEPPALTPRVGEKLGPGPGAFEGSPTDHWIVPAASLPSGWLFAAARRYWDTFRTPIVADTSLIGALPPEKGLSVTLLAPRGDAAMAKSELVSAWPNVQLDVVSADTLPELQAELDRRARERKEFG